MIKEDEAHAYCRELLCNIENYWEAVNDPDVTWHCHHRDGIKVLPSGMVVKRSREELKEMGRYYGCPANELIFLKPGDHHRKHTKYQYIDISDETRQKMSKSATENNPRYWKGKKKTKEHLEKMAKTRRGMIWSDFGKKFFEHYGETNATAPKLYHNESCWYRKHNKTCRWEVENAGK